MNVSRKERSMKKPCAAREKAGCGGKAEGAGGDRKKNVRATQKAAGESGKKGSGKGQAV